MRSELDSPMKKVDCPLGHSLDVANKEPDHVPSKFPGGVIPHVDRAKWEEENEEVRKAPTKWRDERKALDIGRIVKLKTLSSVSEYGNNLDDFVHEFYYVCPKCGIAFRGLK